MNITLIRTQENLIRTAPLGRYIVEYYADPQKLHMLNIRIYDPDSNTTWDVAPDLHKVDLIEVNNCIWNSQFLYFAACSLNEDGLLKIGLYRYNAASRTCQEMCSFYKNQDILGGGCRTKIFVLNETVMLVQTEIFHNEISGNMIGNIEFVLELLRLDSDEKTPVVDSNFINNGINAIKAVSDNKIMIKTGYSWIEDDRMTNSLSSGAYIESVYVTTTSRFIADLTISSDIIDMTLIDSAYKDRYITCPEVTGVYTHYSLVSMDNNEEKCVFYNNETGERLEYNTEAADLNNLDITYVINGQPYVKHTLENEIDFLNLKKAEMDVTFYNETFSACAGNIFILEDKGKGNKMHIYTYPGLKRVMSEKRVFCSMSRLGDNYYIYC